MAEPLIRAAGLSKSFRTGDQALTVFSDVDLEIVRGESIALVGESGAGKSTLLHILGALERPTTGSVVFQDEPLEKRSEDELSDYRNRSIGYVWQNCHLLPEFTALENVGLPLRLRGVSNGECNRRAETLLGQVGLADRTRHQSGELSGGEQQRVAIARSLVTEPQLLLADEPTGNLDEDTGEGVMDLLLDLVSKRSLAILIATHNLAYAARCDRILRFAHGQLEVVRG